MPVARNDGGGIPLKESFYISKIQFTLVQRFPAFIFVPLVSDIHCIVGGLSIKTGAKNHSPLR